MIAAQIHAALVTVRVVAFDAVFVEDRLDVSRKVERRGHIVDRGDLRRMTAVRHQVADRCCANRLGPVFVATHTAGRFAGLHSNEALHAFDREIVFVEGYEEQRPERRDFEEGRTIFLDRHRSQDTGQRERAAHADRFKAAGTVQRHGQLFQHQQLLDFAALDAFHVAAVVDVGQEQLAVFVA